MYISVNGIFFYLFGNTSVSTTPKEEEEKLKFYQGMGYRLPTPFVTATKPFCFRPLDFVSERDYCSRSYCQFG